MSNLNTKVCDHKQCKKQYASDSNNWWWATKEENKYIILFGAFNSIFDRGNTRISENSPYVLHFCGLEHLMTWVRSQTDSILGSKTSVTVKAFPTSGEEKSEEAMSEGWPKCKCGHVRLNHDLNGKCYIDYCKCELYESKL